MYIMPITVTPKLVWSWLFKLRETVSITVSLANVSQQSFLHQVMGAVEITEFHIYIIIYTIFPYAVFMVNIIPMRMANNLSVPI